MHQGKFWDFATDKWKTMDIQLEDLDSLAHAAATQYLAREKELDSMADSCTAEILTRFKKAS